MQIISPQSAILTAPEVAQSLQYHQARQQRLLSELRNGEKVPKGSSARAPELAGYRGVLKSLSTSLTTLTPHALTLPPPQFWLPPLLTRLTAAPFHLTQAECLMIVDLGVGLPLPSSQSPPPPPRSNVSPPAAEDGEDREGETDGGERSAAGGGTGESLLGSIIEEMEKRLTEEDVRRLLEVVREVVREGKREWEEERGRGEEEAGRGKGMWKGKGREVG